MVIPAIVPPTMSAKPKPATALVSNTSGVTRTDTRLYPVPAEVMIAVLTL